MAEIVPVADLFQIQLVQQARQLAFAWNFLITTPAFQANLHIFGFGVINDSEQAIFHPLQINTREFFALFHGADLQLDVFTRKISAGFRQLDEPVSDGPHIYFAEVQNNDRRI